MPRDSFPVTGRGEVGAAAVWPPPAPPRDLTPQPTITAGRVITKKISEYNYTGHGETLLRAYEAARHWERKPKRGAEDVCWDCSRMFLVLTPCAFDVC